MEPQVIGSIVAGLLILGLGLWMFFKKGTVQGTQKTQESGQPQGSAQTGTAAAPVGTTRPATAAMETPQPAAGLADWMRKTLLTPAWLCMMGALVLGFLMFHLMYPGTSAVLRLIGYLVLLLYGLTTLLIFAGVLESKKSKIGAWTLFIFLTVAGLLWIGNRGVEYAQATGKLPAADIDVPNGEPEALPGPAPPVEKVAQLPGGTEEVPDGKEAQAEAPPKKPEALPTKTELVALNGTGTPEKKPEEVPAAEKVPPVDSKVLLGTWVGDVNQPGYSPGKYQARIVLRKVEEGAEAGTVEYPSLG